MIAFHSLILLYASGIMALIGSIGLVRFPNFYTRAHAGTVVGVGGSLFGMFGLLLSPLSWEYSARLVIIIMVNLLANPVMTHAVADAAIKLGIYPKGLVKNEMPEEVKG